MGVPVLATRVSAIPERVEDGRTALLVEPGQPEAMAAGMVRLLIDQDLRHRIITAARQQVREDFDNHKLIHKLAGVFEQAGIGRRKSMALCDARRQNERPGETWVPR
jgi:glycosyltransferase involved in cell wall biosynthesis